MEMQWGSTNYVFVLRKEPHYVELRQNPLRPPPPPLILYSFLLGMLGVLHSFGYVHSTIANTFSQFEYTLCQTTHLWNPLDHSLY